MPDDTPDTRCAICDAPTANRCSSCAAHGDLFFCSKEHQKLVWKTPREVCGANSNPFRPPALTPDELALLQREGRDAPLINFASTEKQKVVLRQIWAAASGTAAPLEDIKLAKVKHAFLLMALAQLVMLQVPVHIGSPTLSPFHHTAALCVVLRTLPDEVVDPATPNRLLHAILILFTLAELEAKSKPLPAGYSKSYLVVALGHVVALLTTTRPVKDMDDALELLKRSLFDVARFRLEVSSPGGVPQVSIERCDVL